jgi:hypothetical protein
MEGVGVVMKVGESEVGVGEEGGEEVLVSGDVYGCEVLGMVWWIYVRFVWHVDTYS